MFTDDQSSFRLDDYVSVIMLSKGTTKTFMVYLTLTMLRGTHG